MEQHTIVEYPYEQRASFADVPLGGTDNSLAGWKEDFNLTFVNGVDRK